MSGNFGGVTLCETGFSESGEPYTSHVYLHSTFHQQSSLKCFTGRNYKIVKFPETLNFGISLSAGPNHQNYKKYSLNMFLLCVA